MKKILSVGILFLLIGISVTTSTGNINEASRTSCTNPLLPPLMWTEDFTTYFLCIPNNPDGHNVFYYIDWGDGDTTGWLGPFLSNETISISHLWDEGIYSIKLKAKSHYNESKWAEYLLSLSSIEKLFLPKLGYININYKFTIYKEGYDGYMFDWGDGTYSNWVGRIANKSFNYPGEYDIRFKAKDIHGYQTNWSTPISITILPLIGASLGITKVNSGIFSFTIKNFGNEPAVNVSWSIHFDGGIVTSGTGQGPYQVYWTTNGMKNISLFVTENNLHSDTTTFSVTVKSSPVVNLGTDTALCPNDTIILYAGKGYDSYLWSDGSTLVTFNVSLRSHPVRSPRS